jgi:hypothetical protein
VSSEFHHLELLRRGPRAWNLWRTQNPHVTPNLTGITLSVAERQMGPINGGPVNLAEARLRHASLRFATLTNADLTGADLSDTDLREARLIGANLSGANLSAALLDQADFAGACLAGANLSGTSLIEIRNLTQRQIDEATGDLLTLLPPHLSRPRAWTGTLSHAAGAQARTAAEPTLGRMPARQANSAPVKGERMSWLVGGPRTAEARNRPVTPLPEL